MQIKRPTAKYVIPVNAQKVFSGVIFDVYQWQQKLFDGSFKTFEILKRADTTSIFPVLPNGSILLCKQNQPGWSKPVYSGFGGHIEVGETVIESAERELLEETGYKAKEFVVWTSLQTNTKIDRAIYCLVAKGLELVNAQNVDKGGESIELIEVSFEKFLDIALEPDFYENEVANLIYEAKLHPEKMDKLKELFQP